MAENPATWDHLTRGIFAALDEYEKRYLEHGIVGESLPAFLGRREREMLQAAFVAGAKWWEYFRTKGTMWQSDQQLAWVEARRKDFSQLRGPNGEAVPAVEVSPAEEEYEEPSDASEVAHTGSD